MPTLLMTGSAGLIGGFLRERMPAYGWRLRLLDAAPHTEVRDSEEVLTGDIRDADLLATAVAGVDGVVHLAGLATEAPFDDVLSVNVAGTQRLLEACVRAGVRRLAVASSNHAVGFTPRADLVPVDTPLRPDTFYGWSKAAIEALCRLYVDRHHLEIACLRIGSCFAAPSSVRQLSTWLSPDDCARMMQACLTADPLEFAVLYGRSANTRGWWDLEPGRRLGFDPQDDAEDYAADIAGADSDPNPADPEHAWLGGAFVYLEPKPR